MPFTSLAQLRPEDVRIIGKAVAQHWASMPEMVKVWLRQLADQTYGFPVNQLEHSLQTATRVVRAGASEELTVAALCHDIGKAISVVNHGGISAEILKPYVSHETYEIIRTHETFQARYYNAARGRDPNVTHQYADRSWYDLACRFSDEWDQTSFDPDYDTFPLEYFEPMIARIFARPR
jgi:predicted HD phosphohydrolase